MEIHAYDELYIESAQNIMGHMFDFAINGVGMEPDDYARIYAISPIAKQMERGNPTYVAGKTGPEIVRLVIENARYNVQLPEDVMYMDNRLQKYYPDTALKRYRIRAGLSQKE